MHPCHPNDRALHISSVVSEPALQCTVDSTVAATYFDLRLSHYRYTLKNTLRGLDKALLAVIEAGSMFAVFVTVATQIVGDFGYMLLNPRIRFA